MSAPLLISFLVIASPAQGGWEERTFDRTVNAASLRQIVGELPVGNVKIVPSNSANVKIHIVQRIKSNNAEFSKWWINGSTLEANTSGGTFTFKHKLPKDERRHNNLDVNMKIEAELQVPARLAVQMTTGAGNVDATKLAGAVQIHTGAGNVGLRDLDSSSNVSVNSGAGQVTVTGRTGSVKVHSGAGNVDLRDVRVEGRDVDVHVGAGNIEASILRAPAGKLNLSSGVGNVKLHVARGIPTTIVRQDTNKRGPGPEGGTVTGVVGGSKLMLSSGIGRITVNGE